MAAVGSEDEWSDAAFVRLIAINTAWYHHWHAQCLGLARCNAYFLIMSWYNHTQDDEQSDADFDMEDDYEMPSSKAKPAFKAAKGGGGKKGKALSEVSSNVAPKPAKAARGGKKTIEQIYQKKTQLEHILLRPDTYGKAPRH